VVANRQEITGARFAQRHTALDFGPNRIGDRDRVGAALLLDLEPNHGHPVQLRISKLCRSRETGTGVKLQGRKGNSPAEG